MEIRAIVRGAYDLQKIRIQLGNRITANFREKMGVVSGDKMSDRAAGGIIMMLRREYSLVTNGIIELPRTFKFLKDGIISTYAEAAIVSEYLGIEAVEKANFKHIKKVLKDFPIWNEFLEGVPGIGPAMGGVIVSEFDIEKANYPSSLWRYAGLDVAPDGRGRSKKKEHLIDIEYTDSKGEKSFRKSITFNPFLKTKLLGVLGPSFLKAHARTENPYAVAYYDYKHRLENHPKHKEKTRGHRANMANRYMIKRFLVDLYTKWRSLENLPVHEEYGKAKLGMIHK